MPLTDIWALSCISYYWPWLPSGKGVGFEYRWTLSFAGSSPARGQTFLPVAVVPNLVEYSEFRRFRLRFDGIRKWMRARFEEEERSPTMPPSSSSSTEADAAADGEEGDDAAGETGGASSHCSFK